jgi:hypothetical protein
MKDIIMKFKLESPYTNYYPEGILDKIDYILDYVFWNIACLIWPLIERFFK